MEPLLRELCEMVEGQQESEAVEELNKEINDLNEQRLILSQVMRKGYMDSALFYEKTMILVSGCWTVNEERHYFTANGRG